MSRRKGFKHHKQDRGGDNKETISALKTAVREGESFLSTGKDDNKRGSFSAAAKNLVSVKAITNEGLTSLKIPASALEKLARGTKIDGIESDVKRRLIQSGVDAAKATLIKDFGVRFG